MCWESMRMFDFLFNFKRDLLWSCCKFARQLCDWGAVWRAADACWCARGWRRTHARATRPARAPAAKARANRDRVRPVRFCTRPRWAAARGGRRRRGRRPHRLRSTATESRGFCRTDCQQAVCVCVFFFFFFFLWFRVYTENRKLWDFFVFFCKSLKRKFICYRQFVQLQISSRHWQRFQLIIVQLPEEIKLLRSQKKKKKSNKEEKKTFLTSNQWRSGRRPISFVT